ncbi:MAG: reactive intermediate/imine deaminase [Candidatus Marinimicrobia bacterium]|nr:reactive intermediate/imine deaminase [Candidatus Neomarinimicrobiota bacterium]|tara:strand:- start:5110 stop:5490 length:381 start_codon:yes stop_codon:yes gene_type:complete
MKIINTDKSPKAIGPYSQAVKFNQLLFTSGQIPIEPSTGLMVSQNFKDQVYQCLINIKGILEEENLSLNHIIKLTVYVVDLNNFSQLNEVFKDFFKGNYPARSAVEVSRLPKDSQVEIEAVCSYEN